MKFLLPCSFLALSLSLAPLGPRDDHDETELGHHMEKIEDSLKVLRKNLKESATYPAALEALTEIEQHSFSAKRFVPASAAKLPEGERAAFTREYRKQMLVFLRHQLALEEALLDGNAEAAKAAFDQLREMEDPSHERFAPEED